MLCNIQRNKKHPVNMLAVMCAVPHAGKHILLYFIEIRLIHDFLAAPEKISAEPAVFFLSTANAAISTA